MAVAREEVARAAIELERDGRMFYLEAAGRTTSDLARQMFESLANDELDHIEWVRNLLPGVDTAAAANRQLYERLRHIFADVPEAKLRKLAASIGDVKAIKSAIEMEIASVEAYETWAKECDSDEIGALCTTLAGIERFHRQALENTLELFERTPDWFMQEEQWNFEGA